MESRLSFEALCAKTTVVLSSWMLPNRRFLAKDPTSIQTIVIMPLTAQNSLPSNSIDLLAVLGTQLLSILASTLFAELINTGLH